MSFLQLFRRPPRDMVSEHHNRGLVFLQSGFLDEAENEFNAALEVNAEHVPSLLELAKLCLAMDRLDEGLTLCQRALKADAELAEPFFVLGRVYARQGKHDWAIAQFRQALLRDPGHRAAQKALSDSTTRKLALAMGEEGSLKHQQAWALSEFHQARRRMKADASLGGRLKRLFKK